MRLEPTFAAEAAEQLEAMTLPELDPAIDSLSELFGEHTFFIDAEGLFIIEADLESDPEAGRVFKLARWADADRTVLSPHERERTEMLVALKDGPAFNEDHRTGRAH